MPIQFKFRSQKELADYLDRLGKDARARGDKATAYGFEQAAMLVENAIFEDDALAGIETGTAETVKQGSVPKG